MPETTAPLKFGVQGLISERLGNAAARPDWTQQMLAAIGMDPVQPNKYPEHHARPSKQSERLQMGTAFGRMPSRAGRDRPSPEWMARHPFPQKKYFRQKPHSA